jgi:hypothetical protein
MPLSKAQKVVTLFGGGAGADTTAPTVTITSAASTVTAGAFTVTVTFSEAVVGFDNAKITVTNGSAAAVGGTGPYTSVITPTTTGTVTVQVEAAKVTDAAGNANTASNTFSIFAMVAVMWLDFSDASLLFQDTARTTAITADAQTIKGATDKSGNNNHATHATGCTYKVNIANSLSAALFGSGMALSANGAAAAFSGTDTAISGFAVIKSASVSGTRVIVRGENTADGDSLNSWDLSGTNYRYLKRDDVATLKSGSSGISDENLHQFDIVCNGTQVTGTLDGTALFTNSDVDVTALTLDRMTVGNNVAAASYFNGYLMEVLLFSTALTAAPATYIRAYLKAKWATP